MNYRCSYKNNSTFPYNQKAQRKTSQSNQNTSTEKINEVKQNTVETKNPPASNIFSNLLNSVLSPVEKAIGRKINFDDLLLVALIYLLYTEKENDNNVLLLCLLFLLF